MVMSAMVGTDEGDAKKKRALLNLGPRWGERKRLVLRHV
jgi:hypothetical protein